MPDTHDTANHRPSCHTACGLPAGEKRNHVTISRLFTAAMVPEAGQVQSMANCARAKPIHHRQSPRDSMARSRQSHCSPRSKNTSV